MIYNTMYVHIFGEIQISISRERIDATSNKQEYRWVVRRNTQDALTEVGRGADRRLDTAIKQATELAKVSDGYRP